MYSDIYVYDLLWRFCEEDIDQILERRTKVILIESAGKGSTFSKASFATEGAEDIDLDDPDFWQKWAQKVKLDRNKLANKACKNTISFYVQ